VRVAGENANVTPREFQLLIALAKEPGRAFTRLELLERAFGYTYEGLERTVDAHIRNLRRKIEPDADRPTYIETVYGVGYRFAEVVESPQGVA
jgi:two-component system alkaline phosphatase synthesis response regulator PhoP